MSERFASFEICEQSILKGIWSLLSRAIMKGLGQEWSFRARVYGAVGDLGFGRGQIIWRKKDGVLAGGSDPRSDGQVVAW
jgi:gamma-glutamyltranspeptidase